jgi:hypothetical protein
MTYATDSIASRITWCQQQKTLAHTPSEVEGWSAEEAGLRDALLSRDYRQHYRYSPAYVFERYVTGLQDGLTLIRAAAVEHHYATSRDYEIGPRAGSDTRIH